MPDVSEVIYLSDGRYAVEYSDGTNRILNVDDIPSIAGARSLASQSDAISGYKGNIGPDNFGVNWIRTPINYDATSGTAAGVRNDQTGLFSGTEDASWVRTFFGFNSNLSASGLFESGTTNVIENRMQDLIYILNFWHSRNKKVLVALDGPVTTSAADMNLYRDRLQIMLRRLPNQGNFNYIDAVQPANEPYNSLVSNFGANTGTLGMQKIAELQRVTYVLFKLLSPDTVVLSSCFQGGETWAPEEIMKASAVGCTVRGSDGAGTRGEMFMDGISYHPYGIGTTLALADQNFTRAYTESAMIEYSSWIRTAVSNRRKATDGGSTWWNGRPDPQYWATEVNVTFDGSNITSNTAFRMQAYTRQQRARHLRAVIQGCFAAGYDVVIPYAIDHTGNQGPWSPTVGQFGVAANGDIRINSSPVAAFNGDVLFLAGGSMPGNGEAAGIVYNASANGLSFDVAGVPSGTNPTFANLHRWLLGGWHLEWKQIQASLTGYAEFSHKTVSDPSDPLQIQYRINRGQVYRTVSGKDTAI